MGNEKTKPHEDTDRKLVARELPKLAARAAAVANRFSELWTQVLLDGITGNERTSSRDTVALGLTTLAHDLGTLLEDVGRLRGAATGPAAPRVVRMTCETCGSCTACAGTGKQRHGTDTTACMYTTACTWCKGERTDERCETCLRSAVAKGLA